jgi:GNAT superfamily N-acetyltransferase
MTRIIKATLSELEDLAKLFDGYRVFYKKQTDLKSAKAFLLERIIKNDAEIFACINADGTMVGFVQLYPLFSSVSMKKLWLLNDLFVDERFRGRGYSIALINKAKELSVETNACGLILETAKDNKIGNVLYPKAGFTHDREHNYYSWTA